MLKMSTKQEETRHDATHGKYNLCWCFLVIFLLLKCFHTNVTLTPEKKFESTIKVSVFSFILLNKPQKRKQLEVNNKENFLFFYFNSLTEESFGGPNEKI